MTPRRLRRRSSHDVHDHRNDRQHEQHVHPAARDLEDESDDPRREQQTGRDHEHGPLTRTVSEVRRALLVPDRQARLVEEEDPAVGHVDLVLDPRRTGRQPAGVAHLAGAVAGPDLDRRVLRERSCSNLGPDEGAEVAPCGCRAAARSTPVPPTPVPPRKNGRQACPKTCRPVKKNIPIRKPIGNRPKGDEPPFSGCPFGLYLRSRLNPSRTSC